MGKAKLKNHKQDEFLLQQVRHLKKELKRKDQTIKQLQKELNYKPSIVEREIEKLPKCDQCGKGFLKEVDFVGRLFVICNVCKFRKKL